MVDIKIVETVLGDEYSRLRAKADKSGAEADAHDNQPGVDPLSPGHIMIGKIKAQTATEDLMLLIEVCNIARNLEEKIPGLDLRIGREEEKERTPRE